MQLTVRFYKDVAGHQPVLDFVDDLRAKEPVLQKLVLAGIRKLSNNAQHGPPLTEMVDKDHSILELRVGKANIARIFFFFRKEQEIILTNGYVKKQ